MAINKRYQWKLYFSTLKCNCNELFEYMLIRNQHRWFQENGNCISFHSISFQSKFFFCFNFAHSLSSFCRTLCIQNLFLFSLFRLDHSVLFKKNYLLNSKTRRIKNNNKKRTMRRKCFKKQDSFFCLAWQVLFRWA